MKESISDILTRSPRDFCPSCQSALSSYGRNGPEHITDPEYWATRTKKHVRRPSFSRHTFIDTSLEPVVTSQLSNPSFRRNGMPRKFKKMTESFPPRTEGGDSRKEGGGHHIREAGVA